MNRKYWYDILVSAHLIGESTSLVCVQLKKRGLKKFFNKSDRDFQQFLCKKQFQCTVQKISVCKDSCSKKSHSMLRTILDSTFESKPYFHSYDLSCCYGIWLGFQSCTQSCSQFTAIVRVAWPSNPNIKKWGQVCLSACGCTSSSIDVDVPP